MAHMYNRIFSKTSPGVCYESNNKQQEVGTRKKYDFLDNSINLSRCTYSTASMMEDSSSSTSISSCMSRLSIFSAIGVVDEKVDVNSSRRTARIGTLVKFERNYFAEPANRRNKFQQRLRKARLQQIEMIYVDALDISYASFREKYNTNFEPIVVTSDDEDDHDNIDDPNNKIQYYGIKGQRRLKKFIN